MAGGASVDDDAAVREGEAKAEGAFVEQPALDPVRPEAEAVVGVGVGDGAGLRLRGGADDDHAGPLRRSGLVDEGTGGEQDSPPLQLVLVGQMLGMDRAAVAGRGRRLGEDEIERLAQMPPLAARRPDRVPSKDISKAGLFLKSNSAMVGAGEGVHLRFLDRLTEHELEFMIVIGKECSQVSEDKALDYVAGYCLSLDMTVRGEEERSFRKSIDSYAVIGPWLVTKDEIDNPNDIPFKLFCNGELRHNAHTNDLIYNCQKLIWLASSFYTLYPGDVIFTGAPAGVGPVKPGDTLTAECAAIGPMEVKIHAYKNPTR